MKSPHRLPPEPRGQTRHCEAAGCTQATREGKPFCSDHVDQHPYVQALLAELKAKDDEEDKAQNKGAKAVALDGINAIEILRILEYQGPRTEERLARDANLEPKAVTAYVAALVRSGRVELGKTNRGSTVVKLAKRKPNNGKHPD